MFSLVLSLLLLFCFPYGISAATKCYSCSTSLDIKCGDPFSSTNVQQCVTSGNEQFNCLTYSYVYNTVKNITFRGCRSKNDDCEDVKNFVEAENRKLLSCKLCSDNLCNSASIFLGKSNPFCCWLSVIFTVLYFVAK